jgi:hypothetical protein
MSPITQEAIDAATAALLALIRQEVHDIMPEIPWPLRGQIPVDKEPAAAALLAKTALAAAAPHLAPAALPQPARPVAPLPPTTG